MTRKRLGIALLLALGASLISCATPQPQYVDPPPLGAEEAAAPRARLYFMGDSQERELFGEWTWYSANAAQDFSRVAQRSLEQDLYAKFVVQQVVDRITREAAREGSPQTILHLGDLLDYSCRWELENIMSLPWLSSPNFFVAPGNHDVVFQGNASYGGKFGAFLLEHFRGVPGGDLDGHHNTVCQRGMTRNAVPPKVAARLELLKALPRYEGAEPRTPESNRALPNRFRCAYLELKGGSNGLQDTEAKQYCEDVLFYSYFKAPNPKALEPRPIRLDTVADRYRAVLSGGRQFNNWDKGFVVQAVRIPISLPGSQAPVGSVVVILLDTTDWSTKPSFGLAGMSDAAKGHVDEEQWTTINRWLKELRSDASVGAVVFAGHYPLKDLSRHTVERLGNMVARDGVLSSVPERPYSHRLCHGRRFDRPHRCS
jgi:hypothetical protein